MELVMLHGGVENGTVYAVGQLSDGSNYLAVANDWSELNERIRASARVEGWTGWALATGMANAQASH